MERRIYQLTNEARRKYHLPPLDKDDALVATARAHSDDMLVRNFFNHVNPDGKAPQDRIAPAYSRTLARTGENIWSGHGYDYSDSKLMARVIVDSWMTSPGHRANLLNPDYTHLGVGVSVLGKEYPGHPELRAAGKIALSGQRTAFRQTLRWHAPG